MDIKSAENIFNQAVKDLKEQNQSAPLIEVQTLAMKRYAEQYIELAASYVDANKEQILKLKNQII